VLDQIPLGGLRDKRSAIFATFVTHHDVEQVGFADGPLARTGMQGAPFRSLKCRGHRQVERQGPSPGLLAFDDDVAVGWCQLTPRDTLPGLDRTRVLKRVDDRPPNLIGPRDRSLIAVMVYSFARVNAALGMKKA
jgi:hypothetical protein